MADRFITAHLRRLPLFAQLTDEQVAQLAEATEVIQRDPGTLLLQQGMPTQGMMLFVSGRGIFTQRGADGVEARVGAVEAGQYINESALRTTGVESASLRLVQPSVVLFIPRTAFVRLISQDMALRANLRVEVAASSVRETPQRLFPWQADDERIEHIFRRHWWSAFRWMWLPLLIGVGVALGGVALSAVSGWLGVLVIGVGVAIPLLVGIYFYYEWQDDCLVITDQRLVRIQEMIFRFEKSIKEIPLPRVLEVSTSLPPVDPFARLFSYGTLEIKTSGTSGTLTLDQMPNPQQVQQAIFKQRDLQQRINTERAREQVAYDVQAALGGIPKQTTEPVPASAAFDVRRQDRPAFLTTRLVADNGDIIYRKHLTIWLRHVLPALLLSLGGLIAAVIGVTALGLPEAQVVLIAGGVLALLSGALWAYLGDWDWRNDLLIIGEDSVQVIHKRPLWLQNQNDTIRIDQIDNVLTDVTGIFDTIFKRGTIRISLLGSGISDAKVFENVPNPEIVQGEISRRQTQLTQQRELDEAERQRAVLRDYLSAYHQINGQEAGDTTAPPPPSQRAQHQAPPPLSPTTNTGTDLPPTSRDAMRPPRIPRIRPDSET